MARAVREVLFKGLYCFLVDFRGGLQETVLHVLIWGNLVA